MRRDYAIAELNRERVNKGLEPFLTVALLATRLHISGQSIRMFSNGIRGGKVIPALPSHRVILGEKARRLFLLSEAIKWRAETGFKASKHGRRVETCPHCGEILSKRTAARVARNAQA